MLSGNELAAEGLGLFLEVLEVLEAFGLAGGGGFEGFGFVVGLAAGDHAVEDAGEFVGGGDEAFGFAEAGFVAAAGVFLWAVLNACSDDECRPSSFHDPTTQNRRRAAL